MYQNESAPWLLFRAWNTDGTPKEDLVYNETGIVLYQARNNEAKSTITLSDASSATDWAAGKFWQISGNLYRVGASTASVSSYTGFITVQGSYTGGTLDGIAVEIVVVPSTHTAANVLTALGTGTWATAIPWNAAWDAEVQSEVNDALVALDLDSALIAQGAERAVNVDVNHRVHSHVYDMQANTVTASALAADAVAEIQSGLAQTGADGDTLETLSDQIDGIGGGGSSGTGARTITVTIDDGTDPLENAIVRMTEGVNTYTALSDVTGVATFNLDDATYVVAITKSGYSYAGTTLLVDGDETETYSLTQVTPTIPDDPALCAVTIHVRDQYGVDLPDEPVEITFVSWAVGAADTVPVLSPPPVQTTDVDGTVAVNLYRNAVYKIIYGSADYALRANVTVPDAGTYEVTI